MSIEAGDEASYNEWEDENGNKCQGARKLDGARHGIVRKIDSDGGWIEEATWYEDKLHGLSFTWLNGNYIAFEARIYDHGKQKARIIWKSDWSEYDSRNKELILMNNGLSIFKP